MGDIRKPVIMAIDDDPVILNTVLSTLKSEYSVRPFTSGEAALKFLGGASADLILMDFQMPTMTGLDVLKHLTENPKTRDIPVIFLTGSADGTSEVEALETGAVDYIQKPVRPRVLLSRVRLQIELMSHRQHLEALVEEKTRSLNEAYQKLRQREDVTLSLLARVTDLRDHDTGNHIERTTEYVRIFVEDLLTNPQPGYTLSQVEAENIIRSSKLHDLGKIAVPDHILLKPGRLTEDEFEIIKQHTTTGEALLNDFVHDSQDNFLTTARDIAMAHHEKWNGTGYPRGTCGEEIPLSARIVAVADVYDALISSRPYKEPYSHEQAVDIIVAEKGAHFDPYLVDVFARNAGHLREVLV